jgi:3-methyladenine DNA glycosylase AlkD
MPIQKKTALKSAAKAARSRPAKTPASRQRTAPNHDLKPVLAWLAASADPKVRAGMARYGIPSDNAVGIPVGTLRAEGKRLGKSHALAAALWKSGSYEARMLATFVEDPAQVTPAQLDRWCNDFDNWAICDTACFHLFDRTPHAFDKVDEWAESDQEFVKRAAFALLASLTVHDKQAEQALFEQRLALVERAATDERNFVKKSVNWALRCIGKRSVALNRSAVAVARRLAGSSNAAARWVGKDALRELTSAAVTGRLTARQSKPAPKKSQASRGR